MIRNLPLHAFHRTRRLITLSCLALLLGSTAHAEPLIQSPQRPVISLIIDDIGYSLSAGTDAISLPGPIAYAFLPHTPHAVKLAKLAHSFNKEIMLHAPMQPAKSEQNRLLGPGALVMDMSEQKFIQTLQEDLESIPHVVGINNHMGSLLTRHPGHMLWLMRELGRRGDLFFIDSLTTQQSIAQQVADEHDVPALQRDIFLDHQQDETIIAQQFDKLVALAKKHGSALGIGHPYPETTKVLAEKLLELEMLEVNLIPVSDLIKLRRDPQWQASLFLSPKAAKSLKQ